MNLSRLPSIIRRTSKGFQVPVTIGYATDATGDVNDAATYAPGPRAARIVNALFTQLAPGSVVTRGMLEIADADAIIDFFPDADLSGNDLQFTVNGITYVAKDSGGDPFVTQTMAGPVTVFQTVALKFLPKN